MRNITRKCTRKLHEMYKFTVIFHNETSTITVSINPNGVVRFVNFCVNFGGVAGNLEVISKYFS